MNPQRIWRFNRGFVVRYPGGVTVRFAPVVLIVRWSGHVPDWIEGRRVRLGPVEIHARRV